VASKQSVARKRGVRELWADTVLHMEVFGSVEGFSLVLTGIPGH
jgi:hypothetical protein